MFLIRWLKYPLCIASGAAIYHVARMKKVSVDYEEAKEEKFRNFLTERDYVAPSFYDKYLQYKEGDHFLEKLILKEAKGFSFYRLYIPKDFLQTIFDSQQVLSNEEKCSKARLSCVFSAKSMLQGHFGIIHGGFMATLIDNLFGYLGTLANDLVPVATANLNINYRKPIKVGKEYMIKVELTKIDGRKVYLSAQVMDGESKVYVDATSLMIGVNWGELQWKKVFQKVRDMGGKEAIKPTSPQGQQTPGDQPQKGSSTEEEKKAPQLLIPSSFSNKSANSMFGSKFQLVKEDRE